MAMTTSSEDRLLGEVAEIEAALHAATPGPWKRVRATAVLVGDGGGIPQTKENAELIAHAPDWLARLCARVRHLEAVVEAYGVSVSQAGAECQRLTEALRELVECSTTNPSAARIEAAVKYAETLVGAGAPPEGEK